MPAHSALTSCSEEAKHISPPPHGPHCSPSATPLGTTAIPLPPAIAALPPLSPPLPEPWLLSLGCRKHPSPTETPSLVGKPSQLPLSTSCKPGPRSNEGQVKGEAKETAICLFF